MPEGVEFEEKKRALQVSLKNSLKQADKNLSHAKQNLNKCNSWRQIHHEADLLKSNFSSIKGNIKQIAIPDWEDEGRTKIIQIDPLKKPQEIIAKKYAQSKRLKRGIPSAEEYVLKCENKVKEISQSIERLNSIKTEEEFDQLASLFISEVPRKEVPARKKMAKRIPYYEFHSSSLNPILVGKTARDNDTLTFKLAKGSDWWLHVAGQPGSHVIIRSEKGKEPSKEVLEDALQLALYYSKARANQEAEVVITLQKNVRSAGKNSPGKVFITKEQTLKFVKLNNERIKLLIKNKN